MNNADEDDDDISITSTAPSDQLSEYEVETILSEAQTAEGVKYLVKWAGYPIERSTWEPAEQFNTEESLAEWKKKKGAIAEGKRQPFDLRGWNTHLISLDKAKQERKRRREAKRKGIGQSKTSQDVSRAEDATKKFRIDTQMVQRKPVNYTQSPRFRENPRELPKSLSRQPSWTVNSPQMSPPVQDQVKPPPAKPPIATFGSAQSYNGSGAFNSIQVSRQKRRSSSDGQKVFGLATKWRYEKAKNYEPEPDISKLDLIQPSEWPPRTGINTSKLGGYVVSSPKDNPPTKPGAPFSARPRENTDLHRSKDNSPTSKLPYSAGDSYRQTFDLFESRENCYRLNASSDSAPAPRKDEPPLMPRRNPGPNSRFLSGRQLFWNPGEILVHLFYGPKKKDLGAVRLCGLSSHTIGKLLSKKKKGSKLEIWFQEVCTLDEYGHLCQIGSFNKKYCDGWVEGFDDTELGVYNVAYELRREKLVAVHFPSDPADNMFIFYPPDPPDFGFLQRDFNSPRDVFLNIAVRNAVGSVQKLQAYRQKIPTNNLLRTLFSDNHANNTQRLLQTKQSTSAMNGPDDGQKAQKRLNVTVPDLGWTIKGMSVLKNSPREQQLSVNPRSEEQQRLESISISPIITTERGPLPTEKPPTVQQSPINQDSLPTEGPMASDGPTPSASPSDRSSPMEVSPPSGNGKESPVNKQAPEPKPAKEKPTSFTGKASQQIGETINVTQPIVENNISIDQSTSLQNNISSDQPNSLGPTISLQPKAVENPPSLENHPTEKSPITGEPSHKRSEIMQNQPPVERINIKALFKDQFGIRYETLATVNSTDKRMANAFFLMFPLDHGRIQEECELIMEFLKSYNAIIYSNRAPEDWEKFIRTAARGVVLFHESFQDYHAMPYLIEGIRKNFNFWTVSLSGHLQLSNHPEHIQRLFPHGGLILLTEDFMLREPDATVIILAWFLDWSRKKFPGSWKIMLRPDILNWLERQPEPKANDRKGIWLAMYALILQLVGRPQDTGFADGEVLDGATDEFSEVSVISPPKLPLYGSRTRDHNPDIPENLTQEQRNTDHLIEFFAGWALVNSHRFRRSIVITTMRILPRWEAWNHLELYPSAREFMSALQIDYKFLWGKLTRPNKHSPGEPTLQTPSVFTPGTPQALPDNANEAGVLSTKNHPAPRANWPQPYQ